MSDSTSNEIFALGQSFLQNFPIPLTGIPLNVAWPSNIVATPLMDGVKLETSANPPSAMIVLDLVTLLQGGTAATRAGKAATPAAGSAAKTATKATAKAKAASGPIRHAVSVSAFRTPPKESTFDSLLDSLQTFLHLFPGLGLIVPAVDLVLEYHRAH